jgi:hypothetical protein
VCVFRDERTNLLVTAGSEEMKLANPDGMIHKPEEQKAFHGRLTFLRLTGYTLNHPG